MGLVFTRVLQGRKELEGCSFLRNILEGDGVKKKSDKRKNKGKIYSY